MKAMFLAAALLVAICLQGMPASAAGAVSERDDRIIRDCMENMAKGCDLVIQGSDMVSKGDAESVAKGKALIREGRSRIDAGSNDYMKWEELQGRKYGSGN